MVVNLIKEEQKIQNILKIQNLLWHMKTKKPKTKQKLFMGTVGKMTFLQSCSNTVRKDEGSNPSQTTFFCFLFFGFCFHDRQHCVLACFSGSTSEASAESHFTCYAPKTGKRCATYELANKTVTIQDIAANGESMYFIGTDKSTNFPEGMLYRFDENLAVSGGTIKGVLWKFDKV